MKSALKLIALVLSLVVLALTLTGCGSNNNENKVEKELPTANGRFVQVGREYVSFLNYDKTSYYDRGVEVVVDVETGVLYLVSDYSRYFSGFTPLFGADGRPLLYDGDLEALRGNK